MLPRAVDVTVFINPHLMWIFEHKNFKTRVELELKLQQKYNKAEFTEQVFNLGEIIVLQNNGIWCRGTIEEINTINGLSKYGCWLLDHGYIVETDVVFKCAHEFRELPALIKQVCLNNVVFLNEHLDLASDATIREKTLHPNMGSRNVSLMLIHDRPLFFKEECDYKGVLFGDILYRHSNKLSSLTETLISKNILERDQEMFKEVIESRITDKDDHFNMIRSFYKPTLAIKVVKQSDIDLNLDVSDTITRLEKTAVTDQAQVRRKTTNSPSNIAKMQKLLESKKRLSRENDSTEISPKTESVSTQTSIQKLVESRRKMLENQPGKDSDNLSDANSRPQVEKTAKQKLLERKKNQLKKNLNDSQCESDLSGGDTKESVGCKEQVSSPENESKMSQREKIKQLLQNRKKAVMEKSEYSCASSTDYDDVAFRKQNKEVAQDLSNADNSVKNFKNSSKALFMPSGWESRASNLEQSKKRIIKTKHCQNKTESAARIPKKKPNRSERETSDYSEFTESEIASQSDRDVSQEEPQQLKIKQFCSCENCEHWTSTEGWTKGCAEFVGETKREVAEIVRPNPFMREGPPEDVKILSVDYKRMTKLQKQAAFKVLVHGLNIPKPVDAITESPFHPEVQASLRNLGYQKSKKIQAFAWPAISRALNVCLVNGASSGKTLSYLPPICTFLRDRRERYKSLSKYAGPIVVILCTTSQKCEEVFDLMNRLLQNTKERPKIMLVTYPFNHINMSYLDVLITLPTVLIDLLKINAVNLKRMCHLVFEDIDKLLVKFKNEIEQLSTVTEDMLSHRTCKRDVQVVSVSEHWTLDVENFVKRWYNIPMICIGNYLEATLYGRMQLKIKFPRSHLKNDYVLGVLKNKGEYTKSIVICSTDTEIKELKNVLTLGGIYCIALTTDMTKEEILTEQDVWEYSPSGKHPVLICNDFILFSALSITSASILIHYSLPETWTMLLKRFICLLENCQSPLQTENIEISNEIYILADDACTEQIPKIISLLKNFNVPCVGDFEAHIESIKLMKEQQKLIEKTQLCPTLKLFCRCDSKSCNYRHIFDKELDYDNQRPKNGKIKFRIKKIVDTIQFLVDLVEHVDFHNEKTIFETQNKIDYDFYLNEIISKDKRRCQRLEKGTLCAYLDDSHFDDVFKRCEILEIAGAITIKILNDSRVIKTKKSQLYELPKLLSDNQPDLGEIEVILANFKPPYKDSNYSARSYFKMKQILEKNNYETVVYSAEVYLQLGNTFWVKNMVEEVELTDVVVHKQNINRILKEYKLAESCNNLNKLYKLCEEAKITLPVFDKPKTSKKVENPQVAPQWAFLDEDGCTEVIFSSAIDPTEVYLRIEKFNELLYKLGRELEESAQKQIHRPQVNVEVGRYYLAKEPIDGTYSRVLVTQKNDDEVLCFSVDFGDEFKCKLSDVKFLSNELITKLPFQAIWCGLYGTKAIDDVWSDEAVGILYNYHLEPDSDRFRSLYVKVCKISTGRYPGQKVYDVLLKDGYGEEQVVINKLLIDCGQADVCGDEEISNFEIPEVPQESEEDEELKEIANIMEKTEMVDSNYHATSSNYAESGFEDDMAQLMERFDFCVYDLDAFRDELTGTNRNTDSLSERTLPAITAAPSVNFCTPNINWHQTESEVKLNIQISDVNEHEVSLVKGRIFNFKAVVNHKKYVANLILFEPVNKKFDSAIVGHQVRFTFTKRNTTMWPRLIQSTTKMRNIHYDVSKIPVEEEKEKRFLDLGFKDDCDSTPLNNEDDIIACDVSDIDSDFDFEIANDSDD